MGLTNQLLISKLFVCILFSLAPFGAQAGEWGVGTVIGPRTGLSVAFREEFQGLHTMAYRMDEDRVGFELDGYRYFEMDALVPYHLELYSGVGVRGEANRNSDLKEQYHMVFPVGIQWRGQGYPLTVFIDQSALLGPLPYTTLAGRAQVGLRATF